MLDAIRGISPGALATILVIVAFAGYMGIGWLRAPPPMASVRWCRRCHLKTFHAGNSCLRCTRGKVAA